MPRLTTILCAILVAPIFKPSSAGADRCYKPGAAAITRAETAAAAWTRKSYQRALAARGLSRAKLGGASIELFRGVDGFGQSRRKAIPYDKATMTEINGRRGLYIGGPSAWSGSARPAPTWELVENSRGEIFRVVRAPQFRDKKIAMCGCAVRTCGPYGSGCPACGATTQQVYGPLPPGAVYLGEIVIKYPARRVTRYFTQTRGCVQRKCPAPPPSMNRGP